MSREITVGDGVTVKMTPEPRAEGQRLCIDLCSGLGGFSRAFIDAGWEVITVDIEAKFNPTICADLTTIDWTIFKVNVLQGRTPDIILAAPPCERFSLTNGRHRFNGWPKPGIGKALAIAGAVMEAIAVLHPHFYVVENPKARLRWFLGTPRHSIRQSDYGFATMKPTDLWTNVEFGMIEGERGFQAWSEFTKHHKRAQRAEISNGLSEAILEAVA